MQIRIHSSIYKFLGGMLLLMLLLSGPSHAIAANIATSAVVNTATSFGQTIKASSPATAVLGLNLAHGTARTLTSVQVTLSGPAGFDPSTDLAALATGATSGVALYADGSVGAEDGVFGSGNGDAVVTLTGVPAYSAATRVSQLTPASTGVYVINGSSNTASPALAVGDIVYKQSGATAGVWGVVTTALSASTLSIDGNAVTNGTYTISKLANSTVSFTTGASGPNDWTGVSGAYTAPALGDIVLLQTGTSASTWGVVTNATSRNQDTFSINGTLLTAATAYKLSKISGYTPATSAVDGAVAGKLTQGLNFAVGDLVIGTTGSGYTWGIVTTAENVAGAGTVSALRVNGASATSLFSTSSQVSKITASATALATAATPTFSAGDIVFGNPVLNAAPVSGYNFHVATTGGAGPAAAALRLDGASGGPFWPYTITLTPASAPSIPADDSTTGNVGADFFVVLKTSSSPVNGHQFNASFRANGDVVVSAGDTVSLAGLPVNTNIITVDTVAPTITASGPASGSTGVPISAFIGVGFSENIDPSTVNSSNISFTNSGGAVGSTLQAFPQGFNIISSSAPTFTASSRFAKVNNTSFGLFQIFGSNTIFPQGGSYTTPLAGDIVYFQHDTFPAEIGLVTNDTMTGGTFAVNNFTLFGGQSITKFATPAGDHRGAVGDAAKNLSVGDLIVANTLTNPTGDRYAWHIVTGAVTNAAINGGTLRLDSLGSAPTFATGSNFGAIAPNATAAVNGSGALTLNLAQGDLIFAKVATNADNLNQYAWHLVTTAENISGAVPSALRLDGASAAPTFANSSQVSKLTPGAEGLVSGATSLSVGDLVMASTTANASNNTGFAFHVVSSGGAINSSGVRFDNISVPLTPSTAYTITVGTGVTDKAGNPLASPQTITFTTGANSGTNNTPPFVQSSIPQPGNQNVPPNGAIKLTFSVDMSTTGGTSGANSVTNPANVGLFLDNFGAPGAAVTATNTYDSASKTVTITPSTALSVNTGYVVKINTSAQSATGTPLPQAYFLSFRTSATTDSTAPTVLGVSPASGATGVSRSTAITLGFSKDMDPSTITSSTVTLSGGISGTVSYNPASRSATFAPTSQLAGNTSYTLTLVAGNSGIKDVAGNKLGAATPTNDYTTAFTTDNVTDTTAPKVAFAGADNFGIAITFNEQVKTGAGPAAADNVANYTLESPVGSSISLAGKTVSYDGMTKTARINGLTLQNGNTFKLTVSNLVQDLAGNGMDTTGSPANNTAFGTVQNSTTTGGNLGPGTGTINPAQQGLNPIRVTPLTRSAGASSNYKVEMPVATSVPAGGKIVLTFPTGFNVTNAAAVSTTNSFCNADLNGPGAGTVTIASVVNDNAAGTVTITTAGAATGANAFLCADLSGIVNSTVPNSAGYSIDIKTRDTAGNNLAILETKTAAPFFLGQAGSGTFQVHVFKDANSNNINDASEGINGVTVFLFSPASGGQEVITANATASDSSAARDGVAQFTNIAAGDYTVGIKPTSAINVAFNSAPQIITLTDGANNPKKFALSNAAAITIAGNIDGSGVANGTKVDVFASSSNGFAKTTITLNGTNTNAYSLPVQANNIYNIGVGPSIPETFFTPGSPPPPPPTFTFMPPPNLQVSVAGSNVTGKNFTLTATNKTITGTVKDSAGTGVSNAGIFCRPPATSTGGTATGFGTGGQSDTTGAFTINVTPGLYLCGVFKPGMPPVTDKQINVPTSGANAPTSLDFVLDISSNGLTITGTVKDDSGNAVPYAGISGRKVVSTSDTTPVGGDASNFVGGPTDANGAYTLYVSAGTWVVEAFAPGFGQLGTKTITITSSSASGQNFSAQTLNMGTITGTVTSGGTSTQGVMVRAENASGTSGNMAPTAADGSYSLRVPAGTYTVKAFIPGQGETTPLTGVTVTANTTTSGKNFTIGAAITITVNVTDGTNPITGAGVDVRDSNGRGNFTNVSTTSGANAVYVVKVPPGTYTVRVGHPAYGPISSTSNVSTTQAITATATAGATVAVTGTVTGDGANLGSAWVSLIGTPTGKTNTIFTGGQSASNGTFSISVPAGSYRLRVDKPGYKSPAESTVTVASSTVSAGTIALVTANRTITGSVTLNGSGVSNAFVDASDGAGGYAVSQTDATGAYSLAVGDGTWNVRAHSQGYDGGPLSVAVSGSNRSGQNITLSAISGFTIKPEKPETVTPTSGGFLTNSDIGSAFKLNIPANALGTGSNAATVTTKQNTAMPNPPTGAILAKNAVTISAVDSSGSPVKNLNDSVTIVVPYDEANLPAGASESSLVLGVYNDATQTYDTLPTTVDTVNNTLTATVSHFSDFAPLVASGEGAPATPTGFSGQVSGQTSVILTWTAVSGAASYNIYRSTDNSNFPLLATVTTNTYTSTGLTTGTTYYFKVSAVNASGAESAATSAAGLTVTSNSGGYSGGGGGGGGGGGYSAPAGPSNLSLDIEGSPNLVSSANVTLKIGATSATEMMIANDINFSGANWVAYATSKIWTLVPGDGVKTIYIKFKDASGNTSTAISRIVTLKASATTNPATPATPATPAVPGKTPASPAIPASPAPKGAHPNGTLVIDGKTIYLIKNGKRYGFRNPDEYKSHGYSFAQAVPISETDRSLQLQPTSVVKALEGTLVLDASDNRTVYMIGTGNTKRGFVSASVFKQLGYSFAGLPKINLSDYISGLPITSASETHPEGALVLGSDNRTVWWIREGKRQGFESEAVFKTYGFAFSRIVKGNSADMNLPEGALVKFRDGTLVKDGANYFLISDGKKMKFISAKMLSDKGYKTANAIQARLTSYEESAPVE